MIHPSVFYDILNKHGTGFYTGVPDSLLKSFCAYLTDNVPEENHIIAANEGCATALAAGYYFSTDKIPLVYMQNSGEGNAVNPLLSLVDPDVYSIPMILLIGWRGEPGVHDEPQHVKQGRVTCSLLDAMQIPYAVLTDDEAELPAQADRAFEYIRRHNAPYAFIIRKGTFAGYNLQNNISVEAEMKREEAEDVIIHAAPSGAVFISTTGMASRELYELREKYHMSHETDFLTVGSMGHASQIALSVSLQKKHIPVFCIDGDGAVIMHMGGMTSIGTRHPDNLVHIVINNGAHDSVGGQPTVGLKIDLPAIACACGYKNIYRVATLCELQKTMNEIADAYKYGKNVLTFIEIKVAKGARADLGRPHSTPVENKTAFMNFLLKEDHNG